MGATGCNAQLSYRISAQPYKRVWRCIGIVGRHIGGHYAAVVERGPVVRPVVSVAVAHWPSSTLAGWSSLWVFVLEEHCANVSTSTTTNDQRSMLTAHRRLDERKRHHAHHCRDRTEISLRASEFR